MKEKDFWRSIQPKLNGHVNRVENIAGVGIPDVNICHNGIETWVELKVAVGRYLLFEWSQISWYKHRGQEQGRVKIVAKHKEDIIICDAEDILRVEPRRKVKAGILIDDIRELKRYSKPYDWQKINDSISFW
tara:strand:- start:1747 stop:2142 length:396 start_codon:yes stop_codon:yes gene_type:complete